MQRQLTWPARSSRGDGPDDRWAFAVHFRLSAHAWGCARAMPPSLHWLQLSRGWAMPPGMGPATLRYSPDGVNCLVKAGVVNDSLFAPAGGAATRAAATAHALTLLLLAAAGLRLDAIGDTDAPHPGNDNAARALGRGWTSAGPGRLTGVLGVALPPLAVVRAASHVATAIAGRHAPRAHALEPGTEVLPQPAPQPPPTPPPPQSVQRALALLLSSARAPEVAARLGSLMAALARGGPVGGGGPFGQWATFSGDTPAARGRPGKGAGRRRDDCCDEASAIIRGAVCTRSVVWVNCSQRRPALAASVVVCSPVRRHGLQHCLLLALRSRAEDSTQEEEEEELTLSFAGAEARAALARAAHTAPRGPWWPMPLLLARSGPEGLQLAPAEVWRALRGVLDLPDTCELPCLLRWLWGGALALASTVAEVALHSSALSAELLTTPAPACARGATLGALPEDWWAASALFTAPRARVVAAMGGTDY